MIPPVTTSSSPKMMTTSRSNNSKHHHNLSQYQQKEASKLARTFSSPSTESTIRALDCFPGSGINAASLRHALLVARLSSHPCAHSSHNSSHAEEQDNDDTQFQQQAGEALMTFAKTPIGDSHHTTPRSAVHGRNSPYLLHCKEDKHFQGSRKEEEEVAPELAIEETGYSVRISDCLVEPHRANSLVHLLKHGVLFFDGRIAVLSGFIPAGVLCRNIGRELESGSVTSHLGGSWCPLFEGRVFPAEIMFPPPFHRELVNDDNNTLSSEGKGCALVIDVGNVGNLVRAASTIIPCAQLRSSSSASSSSSMMYPPSGHQPGKPRLFNAFEYQGASLSRSVHHQADDEVALYHDMWCFIA